jgi:hypothetical protein
VWDSRVRRDRWRSRRSVIESCRPAVKIVLEPVFEADFLPCSFGVPPETFDARCPASPR